MPLKAPSTSLKKTHHSLQLTFRPTSPDALTPKASPLCVEKRRSNLLSRVSPRSKTKAAKSSSVSIAKRKGTKKKEKQSSRKRKRSIEGAKQRKKRKDRESKARTQQLRSSTKFLKCFVDLQEKLEEKEIEIGNKVKEMEQKNIEIVEHVNNVSEKKREVESLGVTIHSQRNMIDHMKQQHAKQMQELKKKNIELTKQHEKALEKKERSLQERLDKDAARYKDELEEARKSLREEKSRQQSEIEVMRNMLTDEKAQHKDEVEKIQKSHEKEKIRHKEEIEKIQKSYEQQNSLHKEEIDAIQKAKDEQSDREKLERERLRKEIEASYKKELETSRKLHEEEKSLHKKEIEEMRQKFDTRLEKEVLRHKEELESKRKLHAEEIQSKCEEQEKMRKMYESKLTKERENERSRGKEAQERIELELEKRVAEKKEYEAQFLEGQKQLWQVQEKNKELEKQKNALQERHVKLESSQRSQMSISENEIDRLKREVKAYIKDMDAMRMTEKSLNEKLLQMEVIKKDLERQKDAEIQLRADSLEKQKELGDVRIDLAVMKNKLETVQSQSKREEEVLKQRMEDMQSQLRKAESRNEKLEKKLEEASLKLGEASSTQNHLAIEKEKLRVQLNHTAELQSKLSEEKSALQKNLTEMSGDVTMKRAERERMLQELAEMKTLKQKIEDQQGEIARLKGRSMGEIDSVRQESVSLKQRVQFLESKNRELEQTIKELRLKQLEDMKIRRQLHNKIIELKGNIRVFCRVRPFLMTEEPQGVFKFPSTEKIEVRTDNGVNSYEFNRIFQPTDTQEDVFIEVQEVVQSALDGYNVCLFAYGQTSSGKTFTMEGPNLVDHKRGLIPRSVEKIFAEIKGFSLRGWEYEIRMSALQIYNEDVFDLLTSSQDKLKLQFGKDKDVKIVNLKRVVVNCPQDVHPLLKEANKNRATAGTQANAESSRSHSVFMLFLKGHNSQTKETMNSRLCLVDLAGSERLKHSQAQGDRLRETQNINKSLHHLKSVIKEIGSKNKHVGFRNSKLTSVLRPSLAGDSKVLMILNLCPGKSLVSESLLSLRFGCEASQVEVGRAKKNVKRGART